MAKSLSVLFVGEENGDTQLILRTLKRGGYKPAYEQVKTDIQIRKALKKGVWEVVISCLHTAQAGWSHCFKDPAGKQDGYPFHRRFQTNWTKKLQSRCWNAVRATAYQLTT